MVLWIDFATGIFAATCNIVRALITTMESERNTVAVCEVVASRKSGISATICRQITFVRDTWIYVILALTHAFPAAHRHDLVPQDAEIVQAEMLFRVQNTKLHPAIEEYFFVFLPLLIYARISVKTSLKMTSFTRKLNILQV